MYFIAHTLVMTVSLVLVSKTVNWGHRLISENSRSTEFRSLIVMSQIQKRSSSKRNGSRGPITAVITSRCVWVVR